ncbi:MAG: hypothetical protein MJ245_02975 [Clostridia bacterium]|nr:hypothetical protein [Clostridia bacterium]
MQKSTKQVQEFQRNAQAIGSKFSSGLGVLSKFAPQLAVLTGGFAAFNATVNSSQKIQDGFNSILAQGSAVVSSFFTNLTTGDFKTFTSGLQDVINKAKAAYEALDDLESFSVRATPEMNILDAKMQDAMEKARNARIKGDKKTYEEQLNIARGYYSQFEKLAKEEANKKLNSARTYLNGELSSYGVEMTDDELKYYFSGTNYKKVNDLAAKYEDYEKRIEAHRQIQRWANGDLIGADSNKTKYAVEAFKRSLGEDYIEAKKAYAANQIKDGNEEFKNSMQNLRAIDNTNIALERKGNLIDRIAAKEVKEQSIINSTKSNSNPYTMPKSQGILEYGSIAYFEQQLNKWTEVYRNAGEENARAEANAYMKKYQEILDGFNPKSKVITETVIAANDDLQTSLNLLSAMSSAFGSIGDSGAQAFANILNACIPLIGAMITLAGAEGVENVARTSKNWYEIAAGIATVTTSILSAVAATKNAGKYANGGIVGGNSYSGDRLIAHVNSGEMILNKRQQGNLFNLIDGSSNKTNNQVEFKLRGQELIGLIKNSQTKNSKLI